MRRVLRVTVTPIRRIGVPARALRTVAVVEPTGSETHVVLRSGGHEVVAMFRDRVSFRPGDTLVLAPDAGKVHLFDKGSGVRL